MTTPRPWLAALAALSLTACTTTTSGIDMAGEPNFIQELPESVVAMAAPHQDLKAVVIMPEDDCYWYRWVGPVETTFLPLRTTEGRMICARAS